MSTKLRFVDSLWARCRSLIELGQFGSSRLLLQRLLQLELPQDLRAEATLMLAELLHSSGEMQAARRHLSAALAGDPDDPALHHMLGCLHEEDHETGNETRALQHLRKAVKLAPYSGECLRALGETLCQRGAPDRGLTYLKKAVRLEPDNLDNLRSLIQALVEIGHIEEAKQTVRLVQFRLGKAHTDVQALWNDLTFAIAHRQQDRRISPSTVPLLKAVRDDQPAKTRKDHDPRILRFDAAHHRKPRLPRSAKERQ